MKNQTHQTKPTKTFVIACKETAGAIITETDKTNVSQTVGKRKNSK